jgi:hypothetical integral membrane protein (TIGR02206 family)
LSRLAATEHVVALIVIAGATAILVTAARRCAGGWLRVLAGVLLVDEVSWWVFLLAGGQPGSTLAYSLPLQLCDVAIFIAAAGLWTRNQLLAEVTYFWGLAGTVQALLTPDLPQHFPSYPYFQYYIAHGGVVAAALILVVGLRIRPRSWAVASVATITLAYAALVGAVDLITGADYMYLRAKPPGPTLLDVLGPWPWYIVAAGLIAFVLFAILDAPFRFWRATRGAPDPG